MTLLPGAVGVSGLRVAVHRLEPPAEEDRAYGMCGRLDTYRP